MSIVLNALLNALSFVIGCTLFALLLAIAYVAGEEAGKAAANIDDDEEQPEVYVVHRKDRHE